MMIGDVLDGFELGKLNRRWFSIRIRIIKILLKYEKWFKEI
jgi:hypothetical protein